MYMGKKLLLAAAMAGIVSGSAFAEDQGSGKIKFKGVVIDAPCSIAPDSVDKEVDLGEVTTAVINANKNPRRFRSILIWKTASLTIRQTKPTRQLPKWMSPSPAQRQTRQTPA